MMMMMETKNQEKDTTCHTFLILYDTCHGATRRIAYLLGKFLSERLASSNNNNNNNNNQVLIENANEYVEEKELPTTQVVLILGSGVHNMTWFDGASRVLAKAKPKYAFSVCSVGEKTSFLGSWASNYVRKHRIMPKGGLQEMDFPVGQHHFFAGAVKTSDWGCFGTLVCYLTGGSPGDRVCEEEVQEFAEYIAHKENESSGFS